MHDSCLLLCFKKSPLLHSRSLASYGVVIGGVFCTYDMWWLPGGMGGELRGNRVGWRRVTYKRTRRPTPPPRRATAAAAAAATDAAVAAVAVFEVSISATAPVSVTAIVSAIVPVTATVPTTVPATGLSLVLAVPQCSVRESITATSPFFRSDRRYLQGG